MNKSLNYKKASIFYMVGTLVNKGIAFFVIPIFTRILSTSDYGIVNTYNSWVGIVGMIIGCSLYMGIRMAFLDYEEKIDDFMSVIVTFTVGVSVLFLSGYVFFSVIVNNNADLLLGVLCILHGTASMLVEDYLMYLQMKFKYKSRTLLMLLPNVISISIAIILIKFFLKDNLYLGRIIPTAGVFIVIAIFIAVIVYRKSCVFYNKEFISYALKISMPLILHGIALNILSQSDRIMITNMVDSAQSGIYSLIYNYGTIAVVIATGFCGVWDPWMFKQIKENNYKKINSVAKEYIKLISYAMVGLILAGPEIIKILASKSYWEGIKIVPAIVLANYIIYAYSFYVNIEHYYKKTNRIAINTIIAAVSNLILNFIYIPKYGYVAAAYTTVVSYMICLILHIIYSRKLSAQLFSVKIFIMPIIQILISVFLFYAFLSCALVRWLLFAAYSIILLVLNRKIIIKYFPEIFERVGKKK